MRLPQNWFDSGKLRAVVDTVLPLSEATPRFKNSSQTDIRAENALKVINQIRDKKENNMLPVFAVYSVLIV